MSHRCPLFLSGRGRLFALCGLLWLVAPTWAHAVAQGEWVETESPIDTLAGGGDLIVLAEGTPLLFGLGVAGVQQYHADTGAWTAQGSLQSRRGGATLTVLPSDVVLVTGGFASADAVLNTAEVYDPAAGTALLTGSMHFARTGHKATLLASGKVLVSGGTGGSGQFVGPAEIYDPGTGAWTLTGTLNQPRFSHAAVRLANGKVFVAGGTGPNGSPLASAELYDPATGAWSPASVMERGRTQAFGVALADGRILVVGIGSQGLAIQLESQLYNPISNTWGPSVFISSFGQHIVFAAGLVILHDGTPLLITGFCILGCFIDGAVLFDVQAGRWSATAPLVSQGGPLVVLPDGRALMIGFVGGFVGASGFVAQLFRPDDTTPRLAVSPLTLDFGQTSPGIGVQRVITVRNTGGATLTGSATTTPPFAVASGSPFTLAPGARAAVVVRFSPNEFGTFPGVVRFTSNGNSMAVPANGGTGLLDGVDAFVNGLYQDVLGRAADAPGFAVWSGLLRQQCNPSGFRGVADAFFDSQEFRTSRPLTLSGLVTAVYRALLARDPEPAGLVGLVDVFRQGRRRAAIAFVDSAEFASLLPDQTNRPAVAAVVARFYTEFLGRTPDPASLTEWVDYIAATRDIEGTAGAFVTSAEFEARPLTSRDYVTLLYRGILGRNPDPGGLDGFDGALRSDLLAVVNGGFVPSAEFQGRIPHICGS